MLNVDDERGLQYRGSRVELCGYVIVDFYLEGDFKCLLREDNSLGNG